MLWTSPIKISKLVKFSPKCNAIFDKLKEELSPDTPGFRILCPTHWTVQAKSLQSVQNNYSVLQELWDFVLDDVVDPDIRACVSSVRIHMESFNYFFGISIAELVLRHSDNLSATLKSSTISAAEGQHVASQYYCHDAHRRKFQSLLGIGAEEGSSSSCQ